MKEKLSKLINVKTIVTLIFVIFYQIFIWLKVVPNSDYAELVKLIVIFYFGTQVGKAENIERK